MPDNFFPNSVVKQYKKGTILLHQGEKAKYSYLVLKGCLKSYFIDNEGKEHIVQFAPEDWMISDLDSFVNGVPAATTIEVIEDSELVVSSRPPDKDMDNLPQEQAFMLFQKMQNRLVASNKRVIHLLSSTAEERYLDFIATYPTLHQRLPLKLIASYLGITPEFLSRTRKHLAEKAPK